MIACKLGYMRIVQYLCHKGATLNLQDKMGYSALTHATENRHIDVCKELISRHAKIGVPYHILQYIPKPSGNHII